MGHSFHSGTNLLFPLTDSFPLQVSKAAKQIFEGNAGGGNNGAPNDSEMSR